MIGVNAIAVLAAGFLLIGSVAAAPIIRVAAAFGLGITVIGLAGMAVLQPLDLTRTELRLDPGSFVRSAVTAAILIVTQLYVFAELGRAPIQAAIARSKPSRWDCATATKAGAAVGFLVTLLLWFMLHGDSANAATSLALQQLGPGYRYALTSLDRGGENGKTVISGVVTAWNDKEIKQVVLHWIEH
jgi:hypothetical protein